MFVADALFWFKVFGIVSVMGVGIVGSYIPFWFRNHKHADAILMYLNMFSAGVLMSTFTVHLLAESDRKIVEAVNGYPIDYVIFGTGALLMVYLSRIGGIDHEDIHALEQKDAGVSAEEGGGDDESEGDGENSGLLGSGDASTARESDTDTLDMTRDSDATELTEPLDTPGGVPRTSASPRHVGCAKHADPVRVGRITLPRTCPRCGAASKQEEWAPSSRGRGSGRGKGAGKSSRKKGEKEPPAVSKRTAAVGVGDKVAADAGEDHPSDNGDLVSLLGRESSPAASPASAASASPHTRRRTPRHFACRACGAVYKRDGRLLTRSEIAALAKGRSGRRRRHKRQSVAMSVFILLCGLMVHAVTSGLAIGLATDMVTCFNLWLCSILHKVAETVAQTLAGIRAGIEKKKNLCLSIVLSMGDPFGQTAGLIIISVINSGDQESALYGLTLFTEVCIFLAAGTMCEIIFEELLYHNLPVKANLGLKETSKRFLVLLAGFIFLDLVAIIDM